MSGPCICPAMSLRDSPCCAITTRGAPHCTGCNECQAVASGRCQARARAGLRRITDIPFAIFLTQV
jgi:hypothetical protein